MISDEAKQHVESSPMSDGFPDSQRTIVVIFTLSAVSIYLHPRQLVTSPYGLKQVAPHDSKGDSRFVHIELQLRLGAGETAIH